MRSRVFYAAAFLVSTAHAGAVELRHMDVRTGTQGLESEQVSVTDKASEPIACHVELAHWYSRQPTRIATGDTGTIDLWFDPETGTYSVLNGKRENMTVETLWCGFVGKAYETRSEIPLDRTKGPRKGRAVICGRAGSRLSCR